MNLIALPWKKHLLLEESYFRHDLNNVEIGYVWFEILNRYRWHCVVPFLSNPSLNYRERYITGEIGGLHQAKKLADEWLIKMGYRFITESQTAML